MSLRRLFFVLLGILFAVNIGYGIDIDSLDQLLNATKNIKRKVDILNEFNTLYDRKDPKYPIRRFRSALQLAKEIQYKEGLAVAHENMANYFLRNNAIDSSISHYNKALIIYQENPNDRKVGVTLYNIGTVYYVSSGYVDALEYANRSLEFFQSIGDIPNIASAHALMCDILINSGFDADAIEHCLSALNLYTEIESLEGQSILLNSIGRIYLNLGQYDKSNSYFNQAYYIAEIDNNPALRAASLRNLGQYYLNTGKYDKALESFNSSLELINKDPDTEKLGYSYLDLGMANIGIGDYETAHEDLQEALLYADSSFNLELKARVYSELGSLYSASEKYDIAIVFLKQSLFVAQKVNADPILQQCYRNLSNFYDRLHDVENALRYYKLYISHKDTIISNRSTMQIAEAEALYALDEKDKQIEYLRNENKLREIEAGEKNMINIWLISVLIFVFILTLVLYTQYRMQNRVNRVLNEQKDAINQQKNEIELQKESIEKSNIALADKNKQITDSLEYAKRIQLSLLPNGNLLNKKFSDAFIWYHPRDIVGGDFYWYSEIKDTLCLIVMDCSGHGVPGAFMTVLANTLLNRFAYDLKPDDSPNKVLKYLDENVKKELNQQGIQLSALEGIDLAVCFIDTKVRSLKFAGAKLPLYYFSGGVLNHVKGNRNSVGGGSNTVRRFKVTSIQLNPGDIIYLATDGFQDQFGGENGKKYMKLHFKTLLQSLTDLPLDEQSKKIKTAFQEWKDSNTQTDDVLVLGIRI